MSRERVQLGIFLRARRDQLTPAQAGIEPFPGARRVPGLRRDELAVLAGLSPDYYGRIEQGRQSNISAEVLGALGRALRLTDVEIAHLHDLAAPTPAGRGAVTEAPQRADPGLLRVMSMLDHIPVLLLGRRGDVLARNAMVPAVLGTALPPGSSFPRFMFLEPLARERIINWTDFARATVGALRRETARHPHDRRLVALVDELCAGDEQAAVWWKDHSVRDYASVAKRIQHPAGGELSFDIEMLTGPQDPEQRLVVYTREPDSPTAHRLPLIGSWSDGSDEQAPPERLGDHRHR